MRDIIIDINDLLGMADLYNAAMSTEDVTLSGRLFKDSGKLSKLRTGSGLTVERWNESIQWFSDHWPEDAIWPVEIRRPPLTPAAAEAAKGA